MTVYSLVVTGYHSSNPCMVIINNFSNTIIIGKLIQVISKQKYPSQLGYFRVHCKNSTFKSECP